MRTSFRLVILSTMILFSACGEESDRYEIVNKLRAFGVSAVPAVSAPSTPATPRSVTLTVHAAVPKGETVTASSFLDPDAIYSVPVEITVNADSAAYGEHNAFQLYTVSMSFVVPPADLLAFHHATGAARLRYAIKLVAGKEEEKILGDYLVFPDAAPQLAWTSPTLSIVKPESGSKVGDDVTIEMAITDNNDEQIRVGWFASSGEIVNHRDASTEWTPGSGPQTLVGTIRGRQSGAFAIQVLDVEN